MTPRNIQTDPCFRTELTLEFTPTILAALRNGDTVTNLQSSQDAGHNHTYSVHCGS